MRRSGFIWERAAAGAPAAESRAEYERVAELNPSTPWAFGGQGLAYLVEGKNAEASGRGERETSEFARLVVSPWRFGTLAEKQSRMPRSPP